MLLTFSVCCTAAHAQTIPGISNFHAFLVGYENDFEPEQCGGNVYFWDLVHAVPEQHLLRYINGDQCSPYIHADVFLVNYVIDKKMYVIEVTLVLRTFKHHKRSELLRYTIHDPTTSESKKYRCHMIASELEPLEMENQPTEDVDVTTKQFVMNSP